MSTKTKAPAKAEVTEKQYKAALKSYSDAYQDGAKAILERDEELQAISLKYDSAIQAAKKKVDAAHATIQQYCEANRSDMFEGMQSVITSIGTICFRKGSGTLVQPEDTDTKSLIALLKKKGLELFISVKESLDSTLIKKELQGDRQYAKKLTDIGFTVEVDEKFYIDAAKK